MNRTRIDQDLPHTQSHADRARLLGFSVLLVLAGLGLALVGGTPRWPSEPPRLDGVLQALSGVTLPLDTLALVLLDLAWLLWAWSVLSLLLELAVVTADWLAHGSVPVRRLRHFADRVSVPLVRRSVAAAFAVQVISRGVPIVAAEPLPPPSETVVVAPQIDPDTSATQADDDRAISDVTYLVRPGDTLWSIAEQAYGSGMQYRRLVDANLGRRMSDGQVFTAQGVVQPGWRLKAPGAAWDIEVVDGQRFYIVRRGDTLSSIATSLLGDSSRWSELFDLNHGATSPDGFHALNDPNMIWPGLRLQLPDSADDATADTPQDPAPDTSELLAASAPQTPPIDSAAEADPDPDSAPETSTDPKPGTTPLSEAPPPLLRTPHALQPVILDPADASANADSVQPPSDVRAPVGAEGSVPTLPDTPQVPLLPLALSGLGLAGVAGLFYGARRARRLRPLPKQPESEVVVQGGFAEAELAHDLTRGLHGVGFDPVAALVTQLEQFLSEYNLVNVAVVSVCHGRSSTTLTLSCGLAEQPLLVDLASAFGETLDAECEACVSSDQDVLFRIVRLRKTRLLPTADAAHAGPCLVPLGVLYDRQIFAAALESFGHVLVVSLPGHGADTILASLVATLTARRSPEQLQLWMLASQRALPAQVFELPHLVKAIDPTDAEALGGIVEQLRAELDRRSAAPQPLPDLLVVVPELTSLGEQAASLALLAGRAADLGVRLIVGSTDAELAATSTLTAQFSTRMVLRMQSEEASVALLGKTDAAFLGGGGRLLLRLDGREPVELYGYQVAAEHLERLVKVMRSAYPAAHVERSAEAPPPHPPIDEPPDLDDSGGPTAAPPIEPSPSGAAPSLEPPPVLAPRPEVPPPPAPIQIRCFGSPRVLCMGQVVWPRGGGDAKPWELLLFLACQPADGASREAVVQAIWPDTELPEGLPHRFRQLRYRLRRQLQDVPDAPEDDGIHINRRGLCLDPDIIYSDACKFLSLVRTARLCTNSADMIEPFEQARALYIGDLLDGADTRRYAWVDERDDSGVTLREHFRRTFQNASLRLAEAYADCDQLESAMALYRELSELDPADERLWVALLHLHHRRRDIAGLEAEWLRMQRALRELAEELDITDGQCADEASRETVDEYQRLRASLRDLELAAV